MIQPTWSPDFFDHVVILFNQDAVLRLRHDSGKSVVYYESDM